MTAGALASAIHLEREWPFDRAHYFVATDYLLRHFGKPFVFTNPKALVGSGYDRMAGEGEEAYRLLRSGKPAVEDDRTGKIIEGPALSVAADLVTVPMAAN